MSVVKIKDDLHQQIKQAADQAGVPITKMLHHLVQEGLKNVYIEGYVRKVQRYNVPTKNTHVPAENNEI